MNLNFIKLFFVSPSQKPSVEINAPITVKKNAIGPNVTQPPTAKPPVPRNNTKKPKNAITSAITPCTPINANVAKPHAVDPKMARTNANNANTIKMKAMITAKNEFQGITTNICHGIQMHQQHTTAMRSIGTVHHMAIGL